MFYEQIPLESISEDIQKCYEEEVKPYKGQLVLHGVEVFRLVGLLRDDKSDGEWCYRFLVFPSDYYKLRQHWDLKSEDKIECCDPSIICGKITPLKGFIKDEDYEALEWMWKMNEERCPYQKDWTIY